MAADKDNTPIKEKLLQSGLKLFSKYGYDATTTRMIAKEAGVVRSSIAFYFETKEALYSAVHDMAMDIIAAYLDPLYTSVTTAYDKGEIDSQNAYCNICRLLKSQVRWYFSGENRDVVRLIMRENSFETEKSDFVYDALLEKFVGLLARLIMTATGLKDKRHALMLALAINGSIQSMGEHLAFTSKVFELNEYPDNINVFLEELINISLDNARLIVSHTNEQDKI